MTTRVVLNRRAVVSAGFCGSLPLLLPSSAAASTASTATGVSTVGASGGFGNAKRCLLLFMWGGPSQLDTFDLKPNAPDSVRGEFRPIATTASGIEICEHFREMAHLMDECTVIRSLSHDDPAHLSSAHTTLTGQLPPVNKSDAEPPSQNDSPHLGALLSQFCPAESGLPSSVTMPWKALHPAAPGGEAPGQTGGWLGRRAEPMLVTGDPSQPNWTVPALQLPDGVDLRRLESRQYLLNAIDRQQRQLTEVNIRTSLTLQQEQAFDLLGSGSVRTAFDLTQEAAATRDRYGRNIHGQCVLLGRRL
ncbi:MAG: DUF1501 domain-containing protein, partial [Planctomycetaceae bacterium]|nr:DUF1501 domain-containing protein [Planctomycetaceae bacterium]